MRIILCLLAICFIHFSIGAPLGRENDSDIKLNKGEVLYDGDIVLTKDQQSALEGSTRTKRSVGLLAFKWPNDVVNYYYDNNMKKEHIKYMEAAFEYIRSKTCINFINDGKPFNSLRITGKGGCASYVGFQYLGEQKLWYGPGYGCPLMLGTAVHELMHALGIVHEQSRFDRDQYLTINEGVVSWTTKHNIAMQLSYNLTPFEYGSTMLYPMDALGTGSIRPKNEDYKYTMGNFKVSFYDMVKINKQYGCAKKCITQLKCKNGGYTNPANCNVCNCPNGYEGALCDQLPKERVTHTANKTWTTHWVNFGDSSGKTLINPDYSYIVITAPAGKTIEVQITKLTNFSCSRGCRDNGVEVKFNGDPRITNPILCCNHELDSTRTYKSKQNPTIISLYTFRGNSKVTYRFRYIDEDFTLGPKTTNGYDSYEYYK